MTYRFLLNQNSVEENVPPGELLLDIIRRDKGLTGTKEACREGDCGACQILVGKLMNDRIRYQAVNACLLPAGAISGRHVVTIEGLNSEQLNPIQRALVDNGAIQCGFCTPGLVMALTGFFLGSTSSNESAALDSIAGNLCRCTGYAGIKRAVSALCRQFDLSASPLERRTEDLITWHILPAYFATVPETLCQYSAALNAGAESGFCPPLPSGEGRGEGVQKNAFRDRSPYSEMSEPLDNAVLIAGGTDLFVQKPEKLHKQVLHFLATASQHPLIRKDNTNVSVHFPLCKRGIEGDLSNKISPNPSFPKRGTERLHTDCIIHALTTIEQIRTSPLLQSCFPRLAEDFKLICSAPIRQRATVGGNLINASPIADLAVFFLALDAQLTLHSGSQTRTVPLQQFFQGYKHIDLKPGERLLDIRFEIPAQDVSFHLPLLKRGIEGDFILNKISPNPSFPKRGTERLSQDSLFSYEKVSKRRHLDIAAVNSALLIQEQAGKIAKVHISAGGVAPYPLYLANTCAYLLGQTVCRESVKTAADIAQSEIAPISDVRGSAQYKRLLLRQLLFAHFVKLFPEIFEGETFNAD